MHKDYVNVFAINGHSQFTTARSDTNILKSQPNSTRNMLRRDV